MNEVGGNCVEWDDGLGAAEVVYNAGYGIGELSVIYIPQRSKYVMLYYRMNRDFWEPNFDPDTFDAAIMMRTSSHP